MSIKVGINGFGRIGRLVFRAGISRSDIEFVGINDPFMTPDYMAYMLRYDTMHGQFDGTIEYTDDAIIVNGKNPIVAHEFLGDSVEGKDVLVIDDMISSGGSMLDVAKQLKERHANRVFVCTTYGLFTDGLDKFDEYYEKGYIDRVITTNLNYRDPELLTKPYYIEANMSKYLASIIDIINHDVSVEKVRSSNDKIIRLMEKARKI